MKVLITRLSKGILSHKLSSDVPRREVGWYRNNYWKMVSCPISHAGKLGNPIHDSGMSGMSIKSRVTWPGHICQNVSKATLWDLSVHLLYVHTKTLWNTEILYFATLMCENLGKAHVFQHTLTNKEETHKKNTHNTYSETFAPPTRSQPPWRNDFTWINHSQPKPKLSNCKALTSCAGVGIEKPSIQSQAFLPAQVAFGWAMTLRWVGVPTCDFTP